MGTKKIKINKDVKQVIILRTDLNMRKGKMVSQGAHGSVTATLSIPSDADYKKQWLDGGMTKITVQVKTEEDLLLLNKRASMAGIPSVVITDAGLTEFKGESTITCVTIGPYWSDEIDVITKDLKLL